MDKTPTKGKTLARITAAILTVAFLGFILTAFFTMVIGNHHELVHSVLMTPELKATLPEHPDKLDRLAARIHGFTAAIAENMWLKDEMGYANSAFQYALGKKVINTGSQNMIRLTTGHYYDLADYKPLQGNAEEIVEVKPLMRAESRSRRPACLGRALRRAGVICTEWTSASRLPMTIEKNATNMKPRKATVSTAAVIRLSFFEGVLFIVGPRYSVTR